MRDRLRLLINRIKMKLWVKPLIIAVISASAVFLSKIVDSVNIAKILPDISQYSIETLLAIISASMLVIAALAVTTMVAAYSSASNTATPRSFPLVISDDVSQNALSTFIGAFIFSIFALIAINNNYYEKPGRFVIFIQTLFLLIMVIGIFIRWVDRIARLGRLGGTIVKVESATNAAFKRRRLAPSLRCVPVFSKIYEGQAIFGKKIGYVQRIDLKTLQTYAERSGTFIAVAALPGKFVAPDHALVFISAKNNDLPPIDTAAIENAFVIGNERQFGEDPRFGLIVLSEIASKALSPAVNDPGTAISIIGSFVRLFALWTEPAKESEASNIVYDRIQVPALTLHDMFDDAFTAIARDGAGIVEVALRLQKALKSLASIDNVSMHEAIIRHSDLALARSEIALNLYEDREIIRKAAKEVR